MLLCKRLPRSDFYLPIINTPSRPYLKWLCNGEKKAEGRVFGSTCRKMKTGATIILHDKKRGEWVLGEIKFLHIYKSFSEMLKAEGVNNMLPFLTENDLQKAVEVYERFPGSQRVMQEGCVAIGILVKEHNLMAF